jgi:hypothetical protein
MSFQSLNLIVMIIPLIVFVVIAVLIRPPGRVIWLSLLAGLVTAGVNMLADALASHFGWWAFPGSTAVGGIGQPSIYLVAWLLYGAGIACLVIGWWVRRKYGWKGVAFFLVALPFFVVLRDFSEAHLPTVSTMVVWGAGLGPWVADFFTWGIAFSAGCCAFYFLTGTVKRRKK